MFQFTLQFLEVIFLVATAYIYWSTRKLIKTASLDTSATEITLGKTQVELSNMTNNLTELLAELQSANNEAHHDLTIRGDNLEQLLTQAEAAITNLQSLIEVAQNIDYPNKGYCKNNQTKVSTVVESPATEEIPLTLVQLLNTFKDDLNNADCSHYTITWTTVYTRRFLMWLHGDDWGKLLPSKIEPAKINSYLNYLINQNYQADIIERTKIALSYFIVWIDGWSELPANKQVFKIEPHSANLPAELTSQKNILLGTNRYQNVLSLASQGLDGSTIAAQTGLEQEAIRLLLTMETPSLISH
ncbi:MAG: phage integrase N-terminal SAM-like domain-containing protein [Anaerolineae bacterium]|nr:phage integrase N-terminal SAM-like domain-containing protein [Anaerolineae bacterium]